MKYVSILLLLAFVVGCASPGAIIVLDEYTRQAPENPKYVKLYRTPPENYQEVGIVLATKRGGGSLQSKINSCMKDLKKKAGKAGANGILLETYDFGPLESGGSSRAYGSTADQLRVFADSPKEHKVVNKLAPFLPRSSSYHVRTYQDSVEIRGLAIYVP